MQLKNLIIYKQFEFLNLSKLHEPKPSYFYRKNIILSYSLI